MNLRDYQFLVLDSIVLITAFFLAIYLLRQKEKHSFEYKIVGCMFLSYLIWELINIDRILNNVKVFDSMGDFLSCLLFAIASTCYSFAYWTYASQYIKTCKILPYFLERAKLLLTQHSEKEKDESENEVSGLSEEHLIKLNQMDC